MSEMNDVAQDFPWYISWVDQHRPNATAEQRAIMYRTFLGERVCICTERQVRYDNGEYSRTSEMDTSRCPLHASRD